jgi:predicted dehydrogenase
MTQVYRVGVLGLGEGRSVLSAVIGSKHWELGNMCDLSEELCRTRQQEFGIDKYTTRYEDMLEDPQIDVIAIYTPDQLHGRHIMQALRAGKHVICTKPLLNNLDEAAELIKYNKKP